MRRRILLIGLALAALLLLACAEAMAQEPGYVGSSKCAQCHGAKYESYQDTWHAKILRPASDDTVLGDFTSTDSDLTFSRDDVAYVVGGQFSQRYLSDIDAAILRVLRPPAASGSKMVCSARHVTAPDWNMWRWPAIGLTSSTLQFSLSTNRPRFAVSVTCVVRTRPVSTIFPQTTSPEVR
jgi:hypothetical protein